jgi:hypothetical protein
MLIIKVHFELAMRMCVRHIWNYNPAALHAISSPVCSLGAYCDFYVHDLGRKVLLSVRLPEVGSLIHLKANWLVNCWYQNRPCQLDWKGSLDLNFIRNVHSVRPIEQGMSTRLEVDITGFIALSHIRVSR